MENLVLIEVKFEDRKKVLKILMNNGKFMALPNNKFQVLEHGNEVLEEIKKAGITPISITS